MTITVNNLLTWCRVPNNHRAAVLAKLVPNDLKDLDSYTVKEIQTAIKGFRMLPEVVDRFNLTVSTTKRMTQLVLWVKDRVRLGQPSEFENGTTQADFFSAIEEAQQCKMICMERKKLAERLTTLKIDLPVMP